MKVNRKKLADLATITLACEPETEQIEGNASAIGPDEDRETAEWIRSQLRRGNDWAWCSVAVSATYLGFSATDYLGCCSYESESAFRADDYFTSMVAEAIERLAVAIEQSATRLESIKREIGA